MEKDNNFGEFDILRGIAIWIVVFAHNIFYQVQSFDSPSFDLIAVSLRFLNFAMPVFFFITGYYSIRVARRNSKHFILSRLRMIGIPYLLWSTIYLVLEYLLKDIVNFKMNFTFKGITMNYVLGGMVQEYYFIFVLIVFYLLTPFLAKLSYSKLKSILLPLFLIMIFSSIIYYEPNYFGVKWISTFWAYRDPFMWLFFYVWGMVTFDEIKDKVPYWRKPISSKWIILSIIFYILSFWELYFMPYKYADGIPLMAPGGLIFSMVFIPILLRISYLTSQNNLLISKIFGRYGRHTLGIYLENGFIEGFLLGFVMLLYPAFKDKSWPWLNLLLFVTALALSYFTVAITWKLSKKIYSVIF